MIYHSNHKVPTLLQCCCYSHWYTDIEVWW